MGESQSTIGAGKSGAQSRQRFGPDATWFFPAMLVVLLIISPVGFVVCVFAATVGQYRKVRSSRIVVGAAAATLFAGVVGAVADDAGLLTTKWHATSFLSFAETAKVLDALNWVTGNANEYLDLGLPTFTGPGWSLVDTLMAEVPLGLVLGLWLAAAYSGWLAFRRRPLTKFEGKEYEWRRPEGFLDKQRRRASMKKLLTGKAATFPASSYGLTGKVGVGVGDYGVLLRADVSAFQRPTLVFGGPRMGKTRFTLSLLSQLATRGSGVVVIDYKGDGEVPTFWAEFAHEHGRRFLHFQTADKNGAPYKPPAPTAPAQQAFYDPLIRGNATSRTDMLVNSVKREGDAEAYRRAAYEVAQVAFAVAEATGYDMQRGALPALVDLLDLDHLQHVADAKDATGRPLLADNPALAARVTKMVDTWKRDDVLRGALQDLARTISTRVVGPAVGAWMRPGEPEQTIDFVRACLEGDIVVFSLPVQEYGDLARDVGTLALLDMQNAIAVLRRHLDKHRAAVGDSNAAPPWAPMYVEIEEFGSAGADAVLDVLNKAGDVQVRPFLSTQSWNDVVAVDGTGVFARRVLDQAGNVYAFQMTDGTGATVLSDTTDEVKKIHARGQTEYSGGWSGMGLKAANLGKIDENPAYERQVKPSAFQKLPRYQMIWLRIAPTKATHSFKAGPNRWEEAISTAPIPPTATVSMSRRPTGLSNEGPALVDIDDSAVGPEDGGVGEDEIPAWGGATAVLPTQPPSWEPAASTEPAQPSEPAAPVAAAPPAPPTTSVELPVGWDDEDDADLHEPGTHPIAPLPTPAPTNRPAPPPPRETPAWKKAWRSADSDEPTEVIPRTDPNAPEREAPKPTHPTPPAAPTDESTPNSRPPQEANKGPASPREKAVAQRGGTVTKNSEAEGFLDLDGFDD